LQDSLSVEMPEGFRLAVAASQLLVGT